MGFEASKSVLFRQVGPRSKVWTEKEMLEMSAWEFAEVSPFALWTLLRKKKHAVAKVLNNGKVTDIVRLHVHRILQNSFCGFAYDYFLVWNICLEV